MEVSVVRGDAAANADADSDDDQGGLDDTVAKLIKSYNQSVKVSQPARQSIISVRVRPSADQKTPGPKIHEQAFATY